MKNIIVFISVIIVTSLFCINCSSPGKQAVKHNNAVTAGLFVEQSAFVQECMPHEEIILTQATEPVNETGSGIDLSKTLNVILSVFSFLTVTLLAKSKGKFKQALNCIKELKEAGDAIDDALADNKIDDKEKERIRKEWGELKVAWKELLAGWNLKK